MNSETKNIPKNYGKQLIAFIKKERNLTKRVLESLGSNHTPEQLNFDLKRKKRGLNRIADLRKIWSEGVFSKEVRILTEVFLKKHSLQWIFNSRLENLKFPIKYRRRMLDGVKNPVDFFYLKDYWLEIFDILSFLQNWNHVINSSSQKNIFYIKKNQYFNPMKSDACKSLLFVLSLCFE